MLTIFKGDDTGGALGKRVALTIVTELPLTGCTVIFDFCGITREFQNVKSGDVVEAFFSHNDTRMLPVGVGKASIRVRDASGKVRTLTNALPIKVTTNIVECYGTDAQNATITIRAVASWDDIINKPFEGVVVNLKTDNDIVAALGTVVEKLGGTVNA